MRSEYGGAIAFSKPRENSEWIRVDGAITMRECYVTRVTRVLCALHFTARYREGACLLRLSKISTTRRVNTAQASLFAVERFHPCEQAVILPLREELSNSKNPNVLGTRRTQFRRRIRRSLK